VLCSKDVRLPIQLQRAMAAEAEATREAKAKVLCRTVISRMNSVRAESTMTTDFYRYFS